jgi:hypothetical protein
LVDTNKVCGDDFVEADDGSCECPKGQVVKAGKCTEAAKPSKPKPAADEADDETTAEVTSDQAEPSGADGTGDSEPASPDDGAAPATSAEGGADPATSIDAGSVASETTSEPMVEPVPKCTSSTDCEEAELCDIYGTEQCESAPDGLGADCSSAADCTDTEATYCEVFQTRTCQIEGCEEQGGVCPGDMVCCQYAVLSNSLCVTADSLEDGECPAPGVRVDREEP